MLKVVLDTNVLVSALLNGDGPPAFILSLVRRRMVRLCLSLEILEEYEAVLNRKKFRHIRNEGLAIISSLAGQALRVETNTKINLVTSDPADNKFIECAVEAEADFLITGNNKHFPFRSYQKIQIVSPREFIESSLELTL